MATDSAVALPLPTPVDHTRNLWQLPVLLLGIAVFVCAWRGFIIGPPNPPNDFAKDVAALKAAYERATPDQTELKLLLNKVATHVEEYPKLAPEARFNLGSGYVRLAEITPSLDEGQGYWVLAHQHFELVNEKQLRDPADAAKLTFRSTKTQAVVSLTSDTPAATIQSWINILSTSLAGEEPGETHRIIAELALRLNPPDINRAKIALTQYLTSSGVSTPPAALARGRLRLGDLYLQTKEYEQALRWLKEIGPDAPPDVGPPTKMDRARAYMALVNWRQAADELRLLRGMPNVPAPIRSNATYQLAVCTLQIQDLDAAKRLFQEISNSNAPEASAAALQLAGLNLQTDDRTQHKGIGDLLRIAMKDVHDSASYDPTLVSLSKAQDIFEQALTKLLDDGAYEETLKIAKLYSLIASPGRDRERRADILGAWGNAMLKAKSGDPKSKFKEAAEELTALAKIQTTTEGKLDRLRRSASFSRQADDPTTAAAQLAEAVKLPNIPEQVMPALWTELADALLAANQPKEVFKIFNQVMANPSAISTATRYRLARAFVDSRYAGLVQTGRMLFEQIAKQKEIPPSEQDYHERALTELANALIRDGKYADAESRLRQQLELYKKGHEAPLARLLLGVCLLQLAATPNAIDVDPARRRAEALANFKQIISDCDAIERRRKLNEREMWLRLQAALRVLQTYQQMKQPAELLSEAGPLLERHKNTVEELIILSLVYHAFRQMGQPGKALDTRDRMKEVLDTLPPSAFSPQAGSEYSREYWIKVWFPPEKK